MKRTSVLALALILVVFAVVMTPSVMAINSDTNSTKAFSVTSEPSEEDIIPVTTTIDSTTTKVNPLEVVATILDSTASAPSWPYIPIIASIIFATLTLVVLALRRRGKFSRIRFISSLVIASLFMVSVIATPVYGQEEFSISHWDLEATGFVRSVISRYSVDSAGNVWFGSLDYNKIGCLNPSTNEVKTWVSPDSGNTLTVSVDGEDNVWFMDTKLSRIGRLNPSTNFFTIWSIPTPQEYEYTNPPGIFPPGILLRYSPVISPTISFDSDGNVYFSEVIANKIGRLNPSTNEVTEWIIPTSDSQPSHTMVDSTGSVWFVEYLGNKIAKLNPVASEVTEWTVPTSDSGPTGLYVVNGQVYFAEILVIKIGRLNPSTNKVTEWSTAPSNVYDIFVDSEGNVWCAAYGELLRLGPDNILTIWGYFGIRTPYGMAIDTKMNVGDIYIAGHVERPTKIPGYFQFLRFHSVE